MVRIKETVKFDARKHISETCTMITSIVRKIVIRNNKHPILDQYKTALSKIMLSQIDTMLETGFCVKHLSEFVVVDLRNEMEILNQALIELLYLLENTLEELVATALEHTTTTKPEIIAAMSAARI